MSRAVEYPLSLRPLGLANRVSVSPSALARLVMRASNEASEPDTCWARATATSLEEWSMSAYRSSCTRILCPGFSPSDVGSCFAARLVPVTMSPGEVFWSTTIAVMIFVRLAIGRRVPALLVNSVIPVSRFSTIADAARIGGGT